ncbi:hypothetical protein ACSSS7_005672 [Eimeria intestinalis]
MSSGGRGRRGSGAEHAAQTESSNNKRAQLSLKDYFCRREAPSPTKASKGPRVEPLEGCPVAQANTFPEGPPVWRPLCSLRSERGAPSGTVSMVIDLTDVAEACACRVEASQRGGRSPGAEGVAVKEALKGARPETERGLAAEPPRTRVLPWERPPRAAAGSGAVSSGTQPPGAGVAAPAAQAAADPIAAACAAAGLPIAGVETCALPTLRLLLPLRLCIVAAATYLQHLLLPDEFKCIQTLCRLLGMPSVVLSAATARGAAAAAKAKGTAASLEAAASAPAAAVQVASDSEATAAVAASSLTVMTTAAAISGSSPAATTTATLVSFQPATLSAAALEALQSTRADQVSARATAATVAAEAGATAAAAGERIACAPAVVSVDFDASAGLTASTPEQDSAAAAAAISAATMNVIPNAATTSAAAELASLPTRAAAAAKAAGRPAASAEVDEPLSEGAQLLFARLLLHLLRLSLTPTGLPAAMRRVSRRSSSKSTSNCSSSSWIRLPPLLRVSREVPSAAAALRELQARGLLVLWTPQNSLASSPFTTTAAAGKPAALTAAECGRCAAAVDGLCSCSWSSALLCLSLGELRDVLAGAVRALGTQRESWGPPGRLKTRGEIVSFLQRLAVGHRPASSSDSSSSSSRRLDEFFGASVICQGKVTRDTQGPLKVPAAVGDAIRSIRTRVVGVCRCLAQLTQQRLLLQSLRVAFLATHAPHAAALGSMASTAPGYVVTAAGQLLQQMQQQRMQQQHEMQQQPNEEDLFAIACAAMLPAVQRVSHLVDLRLRQLPRDLLLQQRHQQPLQHQQKAEQASKKHQQCTQEAQMFDKKQLELSARTPDSPQDLKKHSHGPLIGSDGSGACGNASSAGCDTSSTSHEGRLASLSSKKSALSPAEGDSARAGATEAAADGGAQAGAAHAVAGTGAARAMEAPRLLPVWVCSCCSCTKQRTTAPAPAASSRRQLSLFAAALLAELRMSFVAPEAARTTAASAVSATTGAAGVAEAEALQLACDAERELRKHIIERQEANMQRPPLPGVVPFGRQRNDTAAQPSSSKVKSGASAEATATAYAAADSTDVHLLRFSAPYAWASVLWQSVQLLEQRRRYGAAVERLLLLLQLHDLYSIPSGAAESAICCTESAGDDCQEQQQQPQKIGVYTHRIGRWFSRLTVLLQQHLQQPQRAIIEGVRCLREAGAVRKAERQEITRRVIKAAAALLRKGTASTWEQLQEQALQQQQQQLQQLQRQQHVLLTSDSSDSDASVSNFRQKVLSRTNEADESSSGYSSSTSSSSNSKRSSTSRQQRVFSRGGHKRALLPGVSLRERRMPADTPNTNTGSSSLSLQKGKQQQGQQQLAFLQLLPVDVHNTVLQEYEEHAMLQEQLPLCVVPARPLAATAAAGRSSVFIGWDGLLLRVEQLALQHYCMQGGWQGAHDEGTCLRSIFLILTAAQQQQQQQRGGAGHGVRPVQQHWDQIEAVDATSIGAAAADVAEREVAYSVAFLPSTNPMEETLLLPEQQQQQALLLQQLERSTRREVYELVKGAVAAVYGEQIRGVCWDWRSLADGGYFNADEEQQQQHQQQQQQGVKTYQGGAEDDEMGDPESDADALPASNSGVKPPQSVLQQDAAAATACGHFFGRIAAAIGGPSLASTFSLLSEDFRSWAPGLPDLILWRNRQTQTQWQQRAKEQPEKEQLNPERQQQIEQHQRARQQQHQQLCGLAEDDDNFAEWEVMFAEVKGPRDSLSHKQKVAEPQVAERIQQQQTQEKRSGQVEAALLKKAAWRPHTSTRGSTAQKKAKARQRAEKSGKTRKDVCDEPDAAAISRIKRPNWRR